MISKKELKTLIEAIAFDTSQTQEQIAIGMGYGKNYISEMLSPTGKITSKFITALKSKYPKFLHNPKNPVHEIEMEKQPDRGLLSELLTSYKDRIQEQKEMNDKLTGVINISLNTIVQDTRVSLAYQKAWVDYVAEKDAGGNTSKKEAIVIKMGKLIASKLQMPRQTDIREGGARTDKRAP